MREPSAPDPRQEEFRARLGALGFDAVRFTSIPVDGAVDGAARQAFADWIDRGLAADMHWMERTADRRLRPGLVLPGAKSIVMLGVNYWSDSPALVCAVPAPPAAAPPIWARYALYEDYHDRMKPALISAGRALEELFGAGPRDYRYYVDTGPILERRWAERSGLGFVGKNAMLISRQHGNWLFLAGLLTRVAFASDRPLAGPREKSGPGLLCGKCTRCLDACPTDAFPQPGVLDARRCISYQTIENKGVIPRALRAGIGHRIYGCDICLEVCPWNRFAREGRRLLLVARDDLAALPLSEVLELTPARFAEVFRRTPIKRLKLTGLLRNACVVAGNSGDGSLLPQLIRLAATHDAAVVRAHAVWAVYRLGGGPSLPAPRARESDPAVLAEYAAESAAPGWGL